jgi:hypothetical protein
MTTGTGTSRTTSTALTARGLIGLFGVFFGLCAVLALIVSAVDGWREHARESWPEATATIEKCSVDPLIPFRSSSREPVWFIKCRIGYRVAANQIESSVRSRSTSSHWGGHAAQMREWVASHPTGSAIVVRYDPSDPGAAVLTETDMPDAGPRTPGNLKLLLIASVASLVLLTIARRLRPDP